MVAEPEAKPISFFVLLDGNSQRLFWGQLISQSCDKLMLVGMIWVITTRFSPQWVPWFVGIGALPHFLLSTRAGRVINRFGALPTVVATDALRGVLFVLLALAIPRIHSDPHLLALLIAATFLSNLAGALFNPAILTLPVEMMEASARRDKLTALIDSCFSFGNVLGPLASAVAYSAAGLGGMLAINGASYLFSAILAAGIKLSSSQDRQTDGAEEGSRDQPDNHSRKHPVMDLLRREPVIAGMLLTFLLMNFFLGPLMIFMPWYAKNFYADGIAGLAKLETCLGTGTVLGGALLSFVQLPGPVWKRIALSLSLMAVSYFVFTLSHSLILGCFAVTMLGFFLALANIVILTFFQTATRSEDVATTMGLVNMISVASLPVSMAVVASLIESVSVPHFAGLCALVVTAIAISIGFIPGIKEV